SFAGTRGNDIGVTLSQKIENHESVKLWSNSTALYVFFDKKVGVVKDGVYKLIIPEIILNAAGAREKFLKFQGNTLAGIYGAGAFQTLVNRDLVRPTNRLFIVGGGNVGLIAGYHALQAGIEVVGLVEAMPKVGGYKVHADKLQRLGVPIYTSHTVLSANGEESVESITISAIDNKFKPIKGTEKTFKCDTLLIAVGLESVNEFTDEAEKAGVKVFSAGDAGEIAEASSAMFNGKIVGLKIASELKPGVAKIPDSWYQKAEILKKHPGKFIDYQKVRKEKGVMPVIHCLQEIPCNPCSTSCPTKAIRMDGDPILGFPRFDGNCIGCGQCVAICPGLAITLVDYRKDEDNPTVTMPYEIMNHKLSIGDSLQVVDITGNPLAELQIDSISDNKKNKMQLIKIKSPAELAHKIAGFRIQPVEITLPEKETIIPEKTDDNTMVCLCERVTAGEIRTLIQKGVTDINQIKAITRMGMGPCGSKTCDNLTRQIFREEGIPYENIKENTRRPIFVEIPLVKFSDGKKGGNNVQ
ncbi:MAG: FAD-dependent oxidoreductase, partial [Candidatus Cloacimonetes bacterium]|nr:FAD-dependent oxidoreductase [Candidatus Cloacimonadota bacterium]